MYENGESDMKGNVMRASLRYLFVFFVCSVIACLLPVCAYAFAKRVLQRALLPATVQTVNCLKSPAFSQLFWRVQRIATVPSEEQSSPRVHTEKSLCQKEHEARQQEIERLRDCIVQPLRNDYLRLYASLRHAYNEVADAETQALAQINNKDDVERFIVEAFRKPKKQLACKAQKVEAILRQIDIFENEMYRGDYDHLLE